MKKVRAIRKEQQEIGKLFKSSKIKYEWQFFIGTDHYNLILNHSKITHKYKIFLNEIPQYSIFQFKEFVYEFYLGDNYLKIYPKDGIFELEINHKNFEYLKESDKKNNLNDDNFFFKDLNFRPTTD
jgi:hypothetical protein